MKVNFEDKKVAQMGHLLFCIGFDDNKILRFIKETLSLEEVDEKPRFSQATFELEHFSLAVDEVDQKLFLTGGIDFMSNSECAYVHCYDLELDEWQRYPPSMIVKRQQHSSCTLAGNLYVFCGLTSSYSNFLSSVEVFSYR